MRVVSIVGARPQFVKEAPVGRELRKRHEEILIHTGQHYDENMSAIFFEELGIPPPDFHLGVGSGSHAEQTAEILRRAEKVLLEVRPDVVLVYGDTNSTLAGALACAKLSLPVAHVEAGLRSFDRSMPEEINRVVADHVSDLLLAPTRRACLQLEREGLSDRTLFVGDVMREALEEAQARARSLRILERLGVRPKEYLLLTLHRPSNVDDPSTLRRILEALGRVPWTVLFPIHPRTRGRIAEWGLPLPPNILPLDPLGHVEFVALESEALRILTDSGGVQKEAYLLGVPCVTLRSTTEWVETLEDGWNVLVGTDPDRIVHEALTFTPKGPRSHPFGEGDASVRIVQALEERWGGSRRRGS